MKTKQINYSDEQKHDNYISNFIKHFGKEGCDVRLKGCINRLEDVCTGEYFLDSDMIWYTYIDKQDGQKYDSTLIPERVIDLKITTKQLRGI